MFANSIIKNIVNTENCIRNGLIPLNLEKMYSSIKSGFKLRKKLDSKIMLLNESIFEMLFWHLI